jgi:ABC-type bacteriocin/lantibiotic exporter with double-glycine peptidase domain
VPAFLLLVLAAAAVIAGIIAPRGLTQIAFVFTTLAFLLRFFPAIGQALNLFLRFITDAKAASDVTHILDATEDPSGSAPDPLQKPAEKIELSNLTFGYDRSKPIFQGLRASFAKGRSYAIVGPSGTGKSTVLDLLLGFYQPDQGTIRINEVSLKDIGDRNIRKRVLLVGQQTTILNDTIYNNVRFGLDVRDRDVEEACAVACIDEDIRALELKYHTVLSYQGSNLSGGQRQRIGIARVILRDPDVILLDESTSGLDADTRDRVVGNLLERYKDRIVIFSTHDQAIMRRVDEIVTLESDERPLA